MKIVAIVEDLFFRAKIAETAKILGTKVEFKEAAEDVKDADMIIVDLETADLSQVMILKQQNPRARLIGYLPHVMAALRKQAIDAGFDEAMARSEFSRKLPELLQRKR